MKDLQTGRKVRKHLVLEDDAVKPPIAVLRTRADLTASSSISGPLAYALLEPYRQKRLQLPIPKVPIRFSRHFQQRKSPNLW